MNIDENQVLADRVNDWVGQDHHFSASELKALLWALAMDDALRVDFQATVKRLAADYERERAAGQ